MRPYPTEWYRQLNPHQPSIPVRLPLFFCYTLIFFDFFAYAKCVNEMYLSNAMFASNINRKLPTASVCRIPNAEINKQNRWLRQVKRNEEQKNE